MWTYVYTIIIDKLILEFRHPCSRLLALARMEIGIEHSKVFSVVVKNLICLHVAVVYWNLCIFLERYAIECCCETEDAFYDVL